MFLVLWLFLISIFLVFSDNRLFVCKIIGMVVVILFSNVEVLGRLGVSKLICGIRVDFNVFIVFFCNNWLLDLVIIIGFSIISFLKLWMVLVMVLMSEDENNMFIFIMFILMFDSMVLICLVMILMGMGWMVVICCVFCVVMVVIMLVL